MTKRIWEKMSRDKMAKAKCQRAQGHMGKPIFWVVTIIKIIKTLHFNVLGWNLFWGLFGVAANSEKKHVFWDTLHAEDLFNASTDHTPQKVK